MRQQATTAELSASGCKIDQAILAERSRILAIIEAHRKFMPDVHLRLINLVNAGVDLAAELEKPPHDRIPFMHWPDE